MSHSLRWGQVDTSLPPLWAPLCRWQRAHRNIVGIQAQPGRRGPQCATIQMCRPYGLRSARRSGRQEDVNIPVQTPRPHSFTQFRKDGGRRPHTAPQAERSPCTRRHVCGRTAPPALEPRWGQSGQAVRATVFSRPAHRHSGHLFPFEAQSRTKATLAPSLKGWGTPGGFLQAPRHTSFLNCEVNILVLALGMVARNKGGNLCFHRGQSVVNSQGTVALPHH